MTRKLAAVLFVLSLAVLALALVPAAGLAAKGGNGGGNSGVGHGGGGNGGGGSTSSTLAGPVMVVDNNGNGTANWNDQVTFNVSTTATDRPYVKLDCYQSGVWVSTSTAGFFPESPWAPNFTLASGAWMSGAADCTATLYMDTSNGRTKDLASLSFQVDA
jgi:hypothetical protein